MNSDLILLETDVRNLRSEVSWLKDRVTDLEKKAVRDRAELSKWIGELQVALANLSNEEDYAAEEDCQGTPYRRVTTD